MRDTKTNSDGLTDDIAPLIKLAGARESVDPARQALAQDRVAAHWQSRVAARKRHKTRRRLTVVAMAASIVAAVAVGIVLLEPGGVAPPTTVAGVNRVVGDAYADGRVLERGGLIAADAVIETNADGRLALDLPDGQVMRVDNDSRLVALTGSRFRLESGAVYVDSADSAPSASVYIETPFGVASDVGTQFQVRVADHRLVVGVREGLVALDRGDKPLVSITVGRVFALTLSGESSERDTNAGDPMWQWVSDITPVFEIDGETLYAYLNWYAREKGLELVWQDRQSESRAAGIRLSGSIDGLTLDEGLHTVSRIAPFTYELSGQSMAVRVE